MNHLFTLFVLLEGSLSILGLAGIAVFGRAEVGHPDSTRTLAVFFTIALCIVVIVMALAQMVQR